MWNGYISKFLQRLFGFWLSLVLKEIMVPGRSFNLPASKCLFTGQWHIQGRGPGGPAPPYFWTKLWPEGPKKSFFRPPHTNNLRVWMTGPPLSEGLDDRAPPYLKVWMTGPPLSEGLDDRAPPYLKVWLTAPHPPPPPYLKVWIRQCRYITTTK